MHGMHSEQTIAACDTGVCVSKDHDGQGLILIAIVITSFLEVDVAGRTRGFQGNLCSPWLHALGGQSVNRQSISTNSDQRSRIVPNSFAQISHEFDIGCRC